jgi:hypothetical protein
MLARLAALLLYLAAAGPAPAPVPEPNITDSCEFTHYPSCKGCCEGLSTVQLTALSENYFEKPFDAKYCEDDLMHHYTSLADCCSGAGIAVINELLAAPPSCDLCSANEEYVAINDWPVTGVNGSCASIDMTANYKFTFKMVTPTPLRMGGYSDTQYVSLLRIGHNDDNRYPAVFLMPSSNNLYVSQKRIGGANYGATVSRNPSDTADFTIEEGTTYYVEIDVRDVSMEVLVKNSTEATVGSALSAVYSSPNTATATDLPMIIGPTSHQNAFVAISEICLTDTN